MAHWTDRFGGRLPDAVCAQDAAEDEAERERLEALDRPTVRALLGALWRGHFDTDEAREALTAWLDAGGPGRTT